MGWNKGRLQRVKDRMGSEGKMRVSPTCYRIFPANSSREIGLERMRSEETMRKEYCKL